VRGLARVLLKARAALLRQDYEGAVVRAETVLLLCESAGPAPSELPEQEQETPPRQITSAAPLSRITLPPPAMWQPPPPDPPPKKKARVASVIASTLIAVMIIGGIIALAPYHPSDISWKVPSPPPPPPPPPTPPRSFTGFYILAGGEDANCWSGAFANVDSSSSIEACGDRQIAWSCDRGFDVLSGVVQKQDRWTWTLTLNVFVRGTVRESNSTGASFGLVSAAGDC
jgi:hypothetical protein